jgi:hypothetical protein
MLDLHWTPDSHWDEHPNHAVSDWQDEVSAGDTRESYIDWVNNRIENLRQEQEVS